MELETSGWKDLAARLDDSDLRLCESDLLIRYVTSALVGHFGAETIECHLGKNDPTRHEMSEVAAAAVAHLATVIDGSRVDDLPPAPLAPWDERLRTDPRTAPWRS